MKLPAMLMSWTMRVITAVGRVSQYLIDSSKQASTTAGSARQLQRCTAEFHWLHAHKRARSEQHLHPALNPQTYMQEGTHR
jgi:hypothetical protein